MISLKRLDEIFSYMASLLQFLPKFNGDVVWSLLIDVYADHACSTTCGDVSYFEVSNERYVHYLSNDTPKFNFG